MYIRLQDQLFYIIHGPNHFPELGCLSCTLAGNEANEQASFLTTGRRADAMRRAVSASIEQENADSLSGQRISAHNLRASVSFILRPLLNLPVSKASNFQSIVQCHALFFCHHQ
jgi:hypothetical protein